MRAKTHKRKNDYQPRRAAPSGKYKPTGKDNLVVSLMDGGISQSHQVLAVVSESMGEPAEDPGSSSGNGDKRCGCQKFWQPVKRAYSAPEVRK